MMRNFAFLLCLCLAASFVAAATPGAGKPATPSGPAAKAAYLSPELLASLESHPNLAYAKRGDQELQLDLFRPKDRAGNLPGIVCIHGGGWWKGKREDHADLARALAARGFVTVTITYRLSGEEPFPAQIDDCKAAVRWLRAHAAEYGVDPTAIGAIGHSAGGHLTALLATSGGVKELEGATGTPEDSQSSAIQAAVAMGAQSDFDGEQHIRENDKDPEKLKMWATFLGGSYHAVPERYHAASPLTYLDVSDPPLYFIAGETDTESTRAETTRHRLFALGVPTGLTVIQGTGHNVFANKAMFDQVVRTAGEFFTTHLVDKGRIPVQVSGAGFDSGLKDRAVWRQIGGGYAGCEGAQWIADKDGLTLYFSAQHDHFAFKWTEAAGLKVWRDDSPEATSFRPDGAGGYYVVEQTNRRLVRWDAKGQVADVIADKFEGKRLNRPNDVIVKPDDGTLWFTDPDFLFKVRPQDKKELDGQYVYRFDPKSKKLSAVARDLVLPNGIAISPDQKWLFVTDSGTANLYRWPIGADGVLGSRETFASFEEKGLDGLMFDPAGRLWCATKDGIRVIAPDGKVLGLIKTPGKPTSIAFAPAPSKWVCVTVREAAFVSELK